MTTKQTTAPAMLGTLQAVELWRILCDASLFASTDSMVPSINAVRLEFSQTQVLAVATDRSRLGVARAVISQGDDKDAAFMLCLADVKRLIAAAKTVKTDKSWRYVDMVRCDNTMEFRFNDSTVLAVNPIDSEFPKWRQLFPKTPGTARAATAFTAKFLASSGKVIGDNNGDRDKRIYIYSHDNEYGRDQKPLTVTIGDGFVGLLMPVKFGKDDQREWRLPDWLSE